MTDFNQKGAGFLLDPTADGEIFTPEDLNGEQRAIGDAITDFVKNEVIPNNEKIESKENDISVSLLKKCGELGFLMIEVPESYGGLGLDKKTATLCSENSSQQGSFAVSLMCHTGIGTLPILYFGTEEQKQKYLPKLASGEYIGAYALTEAGSGSDALGAKTKAVLSEDGKHYILNGAKMWITNGAWADVTTVFAKVDGDKFTAFLVENKNMEGVSMGKEEEKMGLHGSSTVEIALDNVKVPVENVLGEIGKGHKIAFNVLNIGRWKLGAAAVGGCKTVINDMIVYSKDRKQFDKAICEFGLVRKMIADSCLRIFATESIVYRIAGLYDEAISKIAKESPDYDRKCIEAIEEYAIEASIAKVYASEGLWDVSDNGVQLLGGYGFSREYPMERHQRDCRVYRIFEGTNEINRLIIPGTILKRAMKGELPLMDSIQNILGELKQGFDVKKAGEFGEGPFIDRVTLAKKLVIYAAGVAVQKYMQDIQNEQYILEKMANMVMEAYVMDSALKRTLKLIAKDDKNQQDIVPGNRQDIPVALCKVIVSEGYEKLLGLAKSLLAEVADGNDDEFAKYKKAFARFDLFDPINTTKLREVIAHHMLNANEYRLN